MKLRLAICLAALCGPAAAESITVYGIGIGAPIAAPECRKKAIGRNVFYDSSPREPCMRAWEPIPANPADFSSGGIMHFPIGEAPKHARNRTVDISATDGVVGAIVVTTAGFSVQESVLRDLIEKFGAPTTTSRIPSQTLMGANFDGIVARWDLDTFEIQFFGVLYEVDSGLLIVGTKAGIQDRQARFDAARKRSSKPL